jgi:hypothetical protein
LLLASPCQLELFCLYRGRYLKFDLGDELSLVVRCTIDAAIKLGDTTQLAAVHALNEFDPKWSGERAVPCMPCCV